MDATRYEVRGFDQHGKPVVETISVVSQPPLTWWDGVRHFIGRWVLSARWPIIGVPLHNLGYRLGVHKWPMVTSISVTPTGER